MKSISLTLPYPISANRYWASRVITPKGGKPTAMPYVTSEARTYKAQVLALARAAGLKVIPGRIALDVKLYPHRPLDWKTRQRKLGAAWDDSVQCIDLDNANKVLLDALKGVVMEDDKWVRTIISQRMEPDDGPARVVVTVTAIEVEQPQMELCA